MNFVTNKQKILLAVLILIAIAAIAITAYIFLIRSAIDENTRSIFTGAEDVITYTDVNGAELTLEDFLGRVLVVTSWASWSPYSESDLTSLNLMAKDFADDDVAFLAINRKETKEQAARFLATVPEFPELIMIIDTQDHFYNAVSGFAMPETIVFDQAGKIVLHVRGALNATEVRSAIESALATDE